MTRLITFGSSTTFGQALPDIWDYKKNMPIVEQGPSKYAWPQLLADKLNLECVNLSVPGASNKEIWYTLLNTKFKANDTVIILWSDRPRSCIIKKSGIENIAPFKINNHRPSKYFLKFIYNEYDHFIDSCMRINYITLTLKNKIKLLKHCMDHLSEFNKTPFPKWFDSNIEKVDFVNDILNKYPIAIDNQHTGKEGNKAFADILYDNIRL